MRGCLDEDEVLAYQSNTLSSEDREAIDEHLGTCSGCLELIHILAASPMSDAAWAPKKSAAVASRIDQYTLLEELGSGGMGFVYAAYDMELDRRVALKQMYQPGPTSSERIRREAQAMARLSHPNVVTVYSVHTLPDDDVAIAMEYIQGQSLRELIASERPMGWKRIRRIFIQAAAGLAAAHDVGLVHRDFKPANLLVTEEGNAKVIDFGLVYSDDRPAVASGSETQASPWSMVLTRTGANLGTPAYMAPEQLTLQPVDSRTDQFAFCLSLFEAVYGRRAFSAPSVEQLRENLLKGDLVFPERPADVPRSVETILRRGLMTDPAQRFTSMTEVQWELERAVFPRPLYRRPWIWAVAGLVGAAVVVGLLSLEERCPRPKHMFTDVWNRAKQGVVRERFVAVGPGYAKETSERVVEGIGRFISRWKDAHVDVCEAVDVRREQTAYTGALQHTCLIEQKAKLDAVVSSFADPTPKTVERAVDMVSRLSVHRCLDAKALLALPLPDDAALAEEVAELRRGLGTLEVDFAESTIVEGLSRSQTYERRARTTGYSPVIAEARYWEGLFLREAGDYSAASAALEEAYVLALESHHLDVAADASRDISKLNGLELGNIESGFQWSLTSRGLARLLEPGGLRDAMSLQMQGMLEALVSRSEEAHAHLVESKRLLRRYYKGPHPSLVQVTSDLGIAYLGEGRFSDALAHFEEAADLATELYGAQHKKVARQGSNIATTYFFLAEEHHLRNAMTEGLRGSKTAAAPSKASGGLAGVDSADPSTVERPTFVDVERILARVLEQFHGGVGEGEDFVEGLVHTYWGLAHIYTKDVEAAKKRLQRGREILESSLGQTHPYLALSYQGLGMVAFEGGELQEATGYLERSIAISSDGKNSPVELAMARLQMARVKRVAREPELSRHLAESAAKSFREQGWDGHAEYAEWWLHSRRIDMGAK